MRIIAQNRATARGSARCHDPVVAAVTGGMPITGRQHAVGKFPQAASPIENGTGYRRRIIGVRRKELAQLFRLVVQLRRDRNEVETGEQRRRKKKGEAFADAQRIFRAPWFRFMTEQTKFPWQFLAAPFDIAVDAVTIGAKTELVRFGKTIQRSDGGCAD